MFVAYIKNAGVNNEIKCRGHTYFKTILLHKIKIRML